MSPRWLHLRDRFGESPPWLPSGSRHSVGLLKTLALSLSLVFALTAVAFAQHPREGPGDPPTTGGTDEGWQLLNIPGLPSGAVLGDVWASPDGKVYVWAMYPGGPAVIGDDPGDGERLPNPPSGPRLWSSVLYRYDGMSWNVALRTPGEIAGTLLGNGTTNVFATTTSQAGAVHVYSFDGTTWAREFIPGTYLGRMHTLAGVPGDLYLKIDHVILHNDGSGFHWQYSLPTDEAAVRGLVYVDALHLFAMCPDGHFELDSGTWTPCGDAIAFTDVEDAWGIRDAAGMLQMYAVGSNVDDNGLYIWKYYETNAITHQGYWHVVATDPAGPAGPGAGYGLHLWGAAGNDIYATGVVAGEGRILRFDGFAWKQLVPPAEIGTVHGVSGNGDGVVWLSTESGQLVRYRRPEPIAIAPVVAPEADAPMQAEVHHGALTVRYALAATTPVELGVYDVMGRQLGTIEDGIRAPGTHEASWNLGSLDSGIYFVKLRTKGTALTRRVVVIR
jgi:hypothetical protein